MPDVADYRVISDGSAPSRPVAISTTPTTSTSGRRSSYVSGKNANNLSFRFSINGTAVRTINVTGNFFATLHEVVRNVTKNNANNVEIRIVGGSGAVTISDIVLFVQRTV